MAEEVDRASGYELPRDVVAAAELDPEAESRVVPWDEVPEGWLGLDIGPETRRAFAEPIRTARTVFWNGPMGVFEWPRFAEGTKAVASGLPTYAQNVHWEPEGAFTGEISADMLLELGVRGSIVGHSERRQYFGETDDTAARRAECALEAGLEVIACVGETEAE